MNPDTQQALTQRGFGLESEGKEVSEPLGDFQLISREAAIGAILAILFAAYLLDRCGLLN